MKKKRVRRDLDYYDLLYAKHNAKFLKLELEEHTALRRIMLRIKKRGPAGIN